jgi:hypothetical protein
LAEATVNEKAKIKLSPEQETLLIPLYAKAQAGNLLFFDPRRGHPDRVDYDFTQLHVPYKTIVLICQRQKTDPAGPFWPTTAME